MSSYDISFDPMFPAGLLIALTIVIGLIFAALAWRGMSGLWWRAGLALALFLALFNPHIVQERRTPHRDIALLIVDETPSQIQAGRLAELRAQTRALEEKLEPYATSIDIRKITLRHDFVTQGTKGTLVKSAMMEALSDVPASRYAGTLLMTDGLVHDLADLDGLPEGPIHAFIVGQPDIPDRRLQIIEAPGFGLVDEPLDLIIRVDDPQATAGQTIRPRLLLDGIPFQTGRIPFNRNVSVRFPLKHRGETIVELSVPELPGELSTLNNKAVLSINGVRDRLQVLLISGAPHPGERVWRNLLKSDPSVELVHFTILRPPNKQDSTPIDELSLIAFPTRELFELRLHEFDLVVFDSYRRRGVLPSVYLGNIVDYVRKGGALLVAAGSEFAGPFSLYHTPLSNILPLQPRNRTIEGPFLPTLSESGRRHPVTAKLPGGPDRTPTTTTANWGGWLRQVDVVHRRGTVVMTGMNEQPLLVLDRIEKGRVAQLSSDHIWLWARGYDGGGPQSELLRRLAHWLMKEPELEEDGLKAKVIANSLEIQLRSLDPALTSPQAEVLFPDKTQQTIALKPLSDGVFSGRIPLTQAGLYRISQGHHSLITSAGELGSKELSALVATDKLLENAVSKSGGRLHWVSQEALPDIRHVSPHRPTGGSGWVGLRANGKYSVTGLESVSIFPIWLLLILSGILLSGAWYRESK